MRKKPSYSFNVHIHYCWETVILYIISKSRNDQKLCGCTSMVIFTMISLALTRAFVRADTSDTSPRKLFIFNTKE